LCAAGSGHSPSSAAYEDSCPHAGVPLSEGTLSGRLITCSRHGVRGGHIFVDVKRSG